MENKEKIYDEKISPLIKQIISICKENKIPMFCEFQFSEDDFCRSCISSPINAIFNIFFAMSQCKEGKNINIDKFLIWMLRTYDNGGSIFLHSYGKDGIKKVPE